MTMATVLGAHGTDADRIWGEAAVLLSLDLSSGLWEFLDTGLDYREILQANRKAIRESRQGFEASRSAARPPRSRISEIALKYTAPIQRGVLSYSAFVEQKFSGFRGYVRNEYFLDALLFDCLNFEQSPRGRLKVAFDDDFDPRSVNQSFDENRAMLLSRRAVEVDRAIESGSLSTWDRELLEKHRGALGRMDPLGAVIQLGICQLKAEAVKKFASRLKPDARSKLWSLFNQVIESH